MDNKKIIEQVTQWQSNPKLHPLTCGTDSNHQKLAPQEFEGGVILCCPDCDYRQDWIPSVVLHRRHNIKFPDLPMLGSLLFYVILCVLFYKAMGQVIGNSLLVIAVFLLGGILGVFAITKTARPFNDWSDNFAFKVFTPWDRWIIKRRQQINRRDKS